MSIPRSRTATRRHSPVDEPRSPASPASVYVRVSEVFTPLLAAPGIGDEEVADIELSRGAVARVLASARHLRSKAAVMFLPGDTGVLDIRDDGSLGRKEINFLVRTRHLFQARDIATVLVDCPSDRKGEGGLYGFRASPEHASDLAEIATYAHSLFEAPVWLAGTSRGAESVVNAAWRFSGSGVFSGLVLLAATTRPEAEYMDLPGCLFDSLLSEIRLPTLIVHHAHDSCPLSPCADVPRMRKAFANARDLTDYIFEGGAVSQSAPCLGLHAHGFFGIEPPVVDAIAKYITGRNHDWEKSSWK